MNHNVQSTAFAAPTARLAYLSLLVQRHAAGSRPQSVLDLGCGSGAMLLALAGMFPDARLAGVDIAAPCIAAARQAAAGSPHRDRVDFVQTDYMDYAGGPFDLMVCDSVVQNMATPTPALLGKLAHDLAPGGILLLSLPYGCAYNHLLWSVRRVLKRFRSPALDRLLLALARALHRRDMDPAMLRERIEYMYFVPFRHDGPGFRQALAAAGLEVTAVEPYPHASPAQPKHRILVLARSRP